MLETKCLHYIQAHLQLHPTISLDNLSLHPGIPTSHQPPCRPRNILWGPQPIERIPTRHGLHQLLALPLQEQSCSRGARRNRIHHYAFPAEILGKHARHLLDRPLGRDVEEVVWHDLGETGERRGY